MKILGSRLKPLGGATSYETRPNKIKRMILAYPGDNFDFVVKDGSRSETKTYGSDSQDEQLKGKRINIAPPTKYPKSKNDATESNIFLIFNEDGSISVEMDGLVHTALQDGSISVEMRTNEILTFNNFKKRI